ncbi:putative membrane protein [Corynebacterium hesseae]
MYENDSRSAVNNRSPCKLTGMRSRQYYVATTVVCALTLVYLLLRWDSVPDPIPVHFDDSGTPDRFEPKSFLNATVLVWIGVVFAIALPLCVPPISLARKTMDVPAESALPFSEATAQRAELLTGKTSTFIAQTVLTMTACVCLTTVCTVVPDIPFSGFLLVAAWIAFTVFIMIQGVRLTLTSAKAVKAIPTDDDEKVRNEALRFAGGMGVYNEPTDPMCMAVFPTNPSKLQINTAHEPGRRYLWRMGIALTASIAFCVLIDVL